MAVPAIGWLWPLLRTRAASRGTSLWVLVNTNIFRYRAQPGIYENRPPPLPPMRALGPELVDRTWLTRPDWPDKVDQTWLAGPDWPDLVDRPGPFLNCLLLDVSLSELYIFRCSFSELSFSYFSFSELSCFRLLLLRLVLFSVLAIQNCTRSGFCCLQLSLYLFDFQNCHFQIFLSRIVIVRCVF